MSYNSKHTGKEVEKILDSVKDKQDKLVSGINIKNVNGQSLLGSGNIDIKVEGIIEETDPVFLASPAASITEEKKEEWDAKQNVITDLDTIRKGASKGATALQEHQDISHLAEKSEVERLTGDVTKHGENIIALQTVTREQGTLVQENKGRLDDLEPIINDLNEEVNILTGIGEGSVVDIASKEVAKVIDSAPETMDTLKKIADLIEKDAEQAADILSTLGNHENRITTIEDKFIVLTEEEYNALQKKEDKFYFCYDE